MRDDLRSGLWQFPALRCELPVIYLQREERRSMRKYRMDDGGVGKFAQKAAGDKRMLGIEG